jgi:hypothetical protein
MKIENALMADLVVPSQIPWERLRGKDLEECVYWLLDSMGAKDLVWRVGGKGEGAADQGRDLECVFYVPGPDAEPQRQRWWIEVKGRSGTLERDAVESAVNHAAGSPDVDSLVIVTNTRFSNPTRDWVKGAQQKHTTPKVSLWVNTNLERLVVQHPEVVIRFFADALSLDGKLEVARSRFWNHLSFSDRPNLRAFWKSREALNWTHQSALAVIVAEAANGDFAIRPWALMFKTTDVLMILGEALLNLLSFCLRADAAGVEQGPYIKGVAYLTLSALHRSSAKKVADVFHLAWEDVDGPRLPKNVQVLAIQPVINQLKREIRDVCIDDCSRVSTDRIELSEEQAESYWNRLRWPSVDDDDEKPKKHLVIEKHDEGCNARFKLDATHTCPLIDTDDDGDVERDLAVFEQVIRERGGKSAGK